jgi:hypothetical protein
LWPYLALPLCFFYKYVSKFVHNFINYKLIHNFINYIVQLSFKALAHTYYTPTPPGIHTRAHTRACAHTHTHTHTHTHYLKMWNISMRDRKSHEAFQSNISSGVSFTGKDSIINHKVSCNIYCSKFFSRLKSVSIFSFVCTYVCVWACMRACVCVVQDEIYSCVLTSKKMKFLTISVRDNKFLELTFSCSFHTYFSASLLSFKVQTHQVIHSTDHNFLSPY